MQPFLANFMTSSKTSRSLRAQRLRTSEEFSKSWASARELGSAATRLQERCGFAQSHCGSRQRVETLDRDESRTAADRRDPRHVLHKRISDAQSDHDAVSIPSRDSRSNTSSSLQSAARSHREGKRGASPSRCTLPFRGTPQRRLQHEAHRSTRRRSAGTNELFPTDRSAQPHKRPSPAPAARRS